MTFASNLTRVAVAGGITVGLLALSAPGAHAATILVDPGAAISAGKPIEGTGQNLPSIDATHVWNIGGNVATEVTNYYSSGAALKDQSEVSAAALAWTRNWVRKACGSVKPAKVRACKAAAVFDVDETLLSNYDWFAEANPQFTLDTAASNAANANCTLPVIEPARQLFDNLKVMGVTPFVITGRNEADRDSTTACLTKAGISGYGGLILKPLGNKQDAAERKADQRKALIKQGWKIGPNVGDQISDMAHGAMGRGFLMPNVMYFIP